MFFRNAASLLSATASFSLFANAAELNTIASGQTVEFQTVLTAGNGNCLTAPTNADGAPVVITDCGSNSTALNSWVVASGSGAVTTLQVFGDKCLDVPNGNDANGQKLQIWTCAAGNTNQMWIPQPGNGITWSGKDKCVDLTDGNLTDGNQIQIWDCDQTESNPNQKWNADAVTLPTSFVISLKKDPSICIAASSATAGAPVVVEPCAAGSASQTWSDPNNDGHIAIFGDLCITVPGVINDGVKLVLAACDPSNANQEFSHTTGVLNSHNVAKSVIDLTDGNETPGTQLQMWTGGIFTISGDNSNQDWIVTNTF